MISTHTHDFHEKNGPRSADFFFKKKKKEKTKRIYIKSSRRKPKFKTILKTFYFHIWSIAKILAQSSGG
jgi:hypothetical protein